MKRIVVFLLLLFLSLCCYSQPNLFLHDQDGKQAFIKKNGDKEWVEGADIATGAVSFRFVTEEVNEGYIILFDQGRNLYLKIMIRKGIQGRYGEAYFGRDKGQITTRLFTGKWCYQFGNQWRDGNVLKLIQATLKTGTKFEDNLDYNSSLTFVLHPTTSGVRTAEFTITRDEGIKEGESVDFSLVPTGLTKDQIDGNYSVDVIINAVGRDHYAGRLNLVFVFYDDELNITKELDGFAIGTYKESNQTGWVINFP